MGPTDRFLKRETSIENLPVLSLMAPLGQSETQHDIKKKEKRKASVSFGTLLGCFITFNNKRKEYRNCFFFFTIRLWLFWWLVIWIDDFHSRRPSTTTNRRGKRKGVVDYWVGSCNGLFDCFPDGPRVVANERLTTPGFAAAAGDGGSMASPFSSQRRFK